MKKLTLMTLAAMSLGLVSCVKDAADYDPQTVKDGVTNAYNAAFVNTFGTPAPNQTWGFTSENSSMRSVFDGHWDGVHNSTSSSKVPCGVNWTDTIPFEIPSGVVTVTANTKLVPNTNYYVPANYNGKLNFDNNFNANIYVAGKVTGYDGGNQQTMNVYIFEKASWTGGFTSGKTTFYNNGVLTLGGSDLQNENVSAIYNAGSFTYGGSNTNANTYLYSTGTILLTADYIDFKLKCDVHNTITANGNIKIQNSTAKYICGLNAAGKVENVDGPLVISTLIANELSFDGNPVYLTKGGHINVATTFSLVNSNSHVYAVTGSNALVETVNFNFGNKNDLTHTFSDNIYFNVTGRVDVANCHAMGGSHNFNNVEEYLAYDGHNAGQQDEYPLAKERVNNTEVSGVSECGGPWGKTTTTPTPDWTFLCRVFAEDLSATDATDFDFNDVVFDVYYDKNGTTNAAQIQLLAAGGTLPLTVGGIEVHGQFGEGYGSGIMINTGAKANVNNETAKPYLIQNVFINNDKLDDVNKNVVVKVTKFGEEVTLKALQGEPAAKFATTDKVDWPSEREAIEEKYPNFKSWVGDANVKWY